MVKRQVPSTVDLPTTLAQRVQHFRESLGITQSRLAELANLPIEQIQDIESGIELFLSPSVRQKLSRVLKIRAIVLKIVEKAPQLPPSSLSQEGRDHYIEEMLHYPHETYPCPECGAPLVVRLFHRRDLEDNPLVEVKANCSQCLFKI